jgi:NAD(P)-dependent dehydrogenase (short-subunit alcohol dehydrogenase family)
MHCFERESYTGKRAVVTGGSTGIGLALAKELVQRGAHVTLIARNKAKIDEAVTSLNSFVEENGSDVNIRGFSADVCDTKQVVQEACFLSCTHTCPLCSVLISESVRQVQAAVEDAGRIDVLICCAGASFPGLCPTFLVHHCDSV